MTDESFLLVKKDRIDTGAVEPELFIVDIIRSYLTEKRAFQDLEILQHAQPNAVYDVISISHIDD